MNVTDKFLADIDPVLEGTSLNTFEFSWKAKEGVVKKYGRICYWQSGKEKKTIERVAECLRILDAPEEVMQAQRKCTHPIRQGVGISNGVFKFYLHSQKETTRGCKYEAWQWKKGEILNKCTYSFYFFGESKLHFDAEQLLGNDELQFFKTLSLNERFRQLSGYWLRSNEQGEIEQIDLCFPWQPKVSELIPAKMLNELSKNDDVQEGEPGSLNVRHIAFKTGKEAGELTFYVSGDISGNVSTEERLQEAIACSASAFNKKTEQQLFAALPIPNSEGSDDIIGEFYNGPIEVWRSILGEQLHYHFGVFDSDEETDMEKGAEDAVRRFLKFLPRGGRIYDVGCGWGGPLQMMVNERGCKVLGLTHSATQYEYLRSKGFEVRLGNAEQTYPPGYFDCVFMMDSLCHIKNKERLLTILKHFTDRVVLRLNCQDNSPNGTTFGDTMHMISSGELADILKRTGWKVVHWENVREKSLASIGMWQERLRKIPETNDRHIETLRNWSRNIQWHLQEWGANNPLIEVVADRAR